MYQIIHKPISAALLLSTLAFLSFSLGAQAQEVSSSTIEVAAGTSTTATSSPSEAELERRLQNDRALERQKLREQRQVALEEVRQARVLNLAANISNRMEAAIERLYDIVGRFEARINKLKVSGVNTSAAEEKLRSAVQLLSKARATLGNIDTLVQNATTSTQPKTDWQKVRVTYLEAGKLIRESHQALRETIALLKTDIANADLQRSAAVNASSSTTTE
jgi:hypothetical protein